MSFFKGQILQEINATRKLTSQQSLQSSFSRPSTNSNLVRPSFTSLNSRYDLTSTANSASRSAFLRSYTNQITSLIINDENTENPLTQLEKIPSIDLTDELLPVKKSKTKKLKILLPEPKSTNFDNPIRTCTSIGEERPKVLLTTLSGRSAKSAQINQFFPKGNPTRRPQRGESMTTISEIAQDKTWRITTQKSISKLPMNVRETRINKILQEVQGRMNNEASSHENSKRLCINLQTVKIEPEFVKESARAKESRIKIVENPYQVSKAVDISKKLNDYRDILKSQLQDLHKTKSHLHIKNKSMADKNSMIRKKEEQVIKQETNKYNQTKKEQQIKGKFAQTIKTILRKLAHMNLTIDEIISDHVFPSAPYEREGSKLFLNTVKNGDYSEIKRLLIMNPYFVYDFDSLKQTALHWASKRGFATIVSLLLETGADYDARDLSGRTPLFLAAKGGHENCVKLLLLFGADPTIKSGAGKRAVDYTSNPDIIYVLNKAFKIHVRLSICSYRKFRQNWNLLDKRDFEVRREELEDH